MTIRDRGPSNESSTSLNSAVSEKPQSAKYPIVALSIVSWYCFSLSISLYNKWMFGPDLDFRFPIIITGFHQVVLFGLSGACLALIPRFRLSYYGTTHSMDFISYLKQIAPCSFASASDIGLANTSLRFVTLSFYTMLKSSSLIFVLLWGVFFKLEDFNSKIFSIVLTMTFGIVLMIWGEQSSFSLFGSFLVLMSSCMSGLRWALTQLLLKHNRHTRNPILTIFYLSPAMFLFLAVSGHLVEGLGNFAASPIWEAKGFMTTIGLLLVPGFLAFGMTLSEFILLSNSALLTLSVAGIFKELLTIFVGWLVFGDTLSLLNGAGLVITICDIVWYNFYRFSEQPTTMEDIRLESVESDNR